MLLEGDVARLVRQRFRVPHREWGLAEHLWVSQTPNLRQMVETRQAFVIADTRQTPTWVDLPETRWIRSHVGAPLCLKHRVLGFLSLDSATPNFFNATHAQRLQAFLCGRISVGIQAVLLQEIGQGSEVARRLRPLGIAGPSHHPGHDQRGEDRENENDDEKLDEGKASLTHAAPPASIEPSAH
jgi:transcriptional regulator with GAF, ATPase, and Fis domain